jgi:hypothetical protein
MGASEHVSPDQFPLFHFEVEYSPTHEDMAAARYKSHRVSVRAPSEAEAHLTASQMAYRHGIPTQTKRIYE